MSRPWEGYTPQEFEQFVRDEPQEAVEWLREQIKDISDPDLQIAAKAMFLLVMLSQSLRLLVASVDDPEYVATKLARVSILLDERLKEMFEVWLVKQEANDGA